MPGSVTKLKVLTAMNRNYLQIIRVEICKTLYLLRYGTSEHPRVLSFVATPFNHTQSVSVRYLELFAHSCVHGMLTSGYSLPYHHVVLMRVTLMYVFQSCVGG